MPLGLLVVAAVLAHAAFNGSRLTISLKALSLGGSPLAVGVMMSLFAALPMLLGLPAGRLVDRVGVRYPMLAAVSLLALSVVAAGAVPRIATLYFAAAGAGTGFMLFHICVQHAIGEGSGEAARKDNFSWLALGFSVSNFLGPTSAGFSIDLLGHETTFVLLSMLPAGAFVLLALSRRRFTHRSLAAAHTRSRSARELLGNRELRQVFVVTGLLASAWDMFVFVMPIYGTSIGLNASTIGLVLGSFAAATFVVRVFLPWLSRRFLEWSLIMTTFGIACVAYALFPMVQTVPLLAAIAFLLGLGLGATQPSIMSLIYSTAPAGRTAEAVGVRSMVLNVSHTFLPLAFGGVGTALGTGPIFWTMSAALAGGGWLANRARVARPGALESEARSPHLIPGAGPARSKPSASVKMRF